MSSFFENQKFVGAALLIIGVIMFIAAVTAAVLAVEDGTDILIGQIISSAGAVLASLLYMGFGSRVLGWSSHGYVSTRLGLSGGAVTGKFNVLVEYVHVFAFVEIITGFFNIISGVVDSTGVWSGIVTVIIGVIAFLVYIEITNRKAGLSDQIIWVLLLVLFALEVVSGIILLFGIVTLPLGICYILIGLFMIMALTDRDVKRRFGM